MSIFIIAEAGINHCGSVKRAMEMIIEAKMAGADAVKFQSFTADNLGYGADLTAFLKSCEFSHDLTKGLFDYAQSVGIEFMSTPFDKGWCDFLVELGVKRLKISSGKVTDLDFVRHVASKRLPIVMSNGLATKEQWGAAVNAIHDDIHISALYCVSEYPAPLWKISFDKMMSLELGVKDHVGFSDHTLTGDASIIAAASGAKIIERHFTLDKSLPGPDQVCSSTPEELRRIIREIRQVNL